MPDATSVPPYLVAILVAAVVALAGAIGVLFRHYSGKQDTRELERRQLDQEISKERQTWALERQRSETQREELETALRLEYEKKHRETVERYVQMMADLHQATREHEDLIRREYAQNMEAVQAKAEAATGKVTAVMDKFYERYVGPRSRMKG